ncbi:MAG TPA: TonB-dependent receptor [Novosphingobium sp.]|nr:TonB-dependent receptor [Novosphingobium sp.]
MKMCRQYRYLAAVAGVLGVSMGAQAAQTDQGNAAEARSERSGGLEDIVVTARRREESLLDVPVAVSAISAAALERAHVTDMTQIAQMTPNVIIAPIGGSGSGGTIAIRGIGSTYSDSGIDQSVGIVIDSVSISRSRILHASQFDLGQVEILKGPQALFFGKNSPAGVISINTANPTPDFSAMARVGYEFEAEEKFVEGFVSGPIAENLLFRVAGKYSSMKGWIKNATTAQPNLAYPAFPVTGPSTGTTPNQDTMSGRLTLKWTPTPELDSTLKVFGNHTSGDGSEGNQESYCVGPARAVGHMSGRSFAPGVGIVYDPQSDCEFNRRKVSGLIPEAWRANWPNALKKNGRSWHRNDAILGSWVSNYDFGDVTLTSVTGLTKIEATNFGSYNGTGFGIVYSGPNAGEDTTIWSQELRLASDYDGPLNFTLGGYYDNTKRDFENIGSIGFGGFDAANGNSMYSFRAEWHAKAHSSAGFGQLRWQILDTLELSGGVRYTNETKRARGFNTYVNTLGAASGFPPAGAVINNRVQFSNWSPEATLSYKPSEDLMFYLAYKTGYKSGGLSTPTILNNRFVATPDVLKYRPERAKGWEAGIKGELFDRTVRFDLVAYRYEFTNIQLAAFDPVAVSYTIRNAGAARTTGVESSIVWVATPDLTLNASLTYNKAVYTDFRDAQCYAIILGTPICGANGYNRTGQTLPRSPRWMLFTGFNYERELDGGWKIGLSGDANLQSAFIPDDNGDPNTRVSSKWRLNAGARFGPADEAWELALIGRNLTDEYFPVSSSEAPFAGGAFRLAPPGEKSGFAYRPREIVVQGTVRF